MDPLLAYATAKQPETVALLRDLVQCESPSDDPAALNRFMDLFADRVSTIAKISRW